MKRVVIHADDFGLSTSINTAIVRAHREGILTSTTLLANGPQFDEAVALAKSNPSLSVGLHLNLYRGRPLTETRKVPSLVDQKTGCFLGSLPRVLWRMAGGGFDETEIYAELNAQAQRLLSAGIFPTHFDSEKHLHHAPKVRKAVIRLAKEMGVQRIRVVTESLGAGDWADLFKKGTWEKFAAYPVFRHARRDFLKAGLQTSDRSFGFVRPMTPKILRETLRSLPDGLSEIMCHPGCTDGQTRMQMSLHGPFFIDEARGEELAALLDPEIKRLIDREGIRVEGF